MARLHVLLSCLVLSSPAFATDAADVLQAWATQEGEWRGYIDIYSAESSDPTTVILLSSWDAVPSGTRLTRIETFVSDQGENSSVTVMYADPETGHIVTPYFAGGPQRDYRFAVISADLIDDTHWTTVIASPEGREEYEGRPAVLRYVRTRTGDTLVSTKEVDFLDDNEDAYELRSYIEQTLIAGTQALK